MRAAGGWAGVVRYLVRCLAGIVRRLAGRSVHRYAVSWIERPRLSSQSPISGRTIHEMNERWTERPHIMSVCARWLIAFPAGRVLKDATICVRGRKEASE